MQKELDEKMKLILEQVRKEYREGSVALPFGLPLISSLSMENGTIANKIINPDDFYKALTPLKPNKSQDGRRELLLVKDRKTLQYENTCSTCEHFLIPNICQEKSDYTWDECTACEFYKK